MNPEWHFAGVLIVVASGAGLIALAIYHWWGELSLLFRNHHRDFPQPKEDEMSEEDTNPGAESGVITPTERICAFLKEHAAWFDYGAKRGGDEQHLRARASECRWIEQAIRTGRYKEDGRPKWLVKAIPIGDGTSSTKANSGMNK